VRKGELLKDGNDSVGNTNKVKVVKNKLAPPFKTANVSLLYGKGIPKGVAVVDMALDYDIIKRKGSWLAYKGETLGQGKESVAQFIEKNPDLEREIVSEVMAAVGKGIGYTAPPAGAPENEEDKLDSSVIESIERIEEIEKLNVEEGILDLSEDEK